MGDIFRDDRICELCRLHKIGDEFHNMLECTLLKILEKSICQENSHVDPMLVSFVIL